MSASLSNSGGTFPLSWGIALVTVSLIAIGGGAVVWSQHGDDNGLVIREHEVHGSDSSASRRPLPEPPPGTVGATKKNVYSVAHAVENGTQVVKIKVTPAGDELIIDANTGRLLETRPNRPPAPIGRFMAPIVPAT
ncbi:MAG TPA: hypothetical protein VHR66_22325 [Gemmataceae bacterium]|jgi:hypothetical protein|nr:hypothetical protein [Gemmataceae bacterium]